MGSVMEGETGEIVEDAQYTAGHVSHVIRAIRPGEIVPPPEDGWLERALVLPQTMSGGCWSFARHSKRQRRGEA